MLQQMSCQKATDDEMQHTLAHMFSQSEKRDPQPFFSSGEHTVPVYTVKQMFFCQGTQSQEFRFHLEKRGIHVQWNLIENPAKNLNNLNYSICQETNCRRNQNGLRVVLVFLDILLPNLLATIFQFSPGEPPSHLPCQWPTFNSCSEVGLMTVK